MRCVPASQLEGGVEEKFYGCLTVVAVGCFSNFRAKVMGGGAVKAELGSHSMGLILENARLSYDRHGTVVLIKGQGPASFYRISKTETRMLIVVRVPPPPDLKARTSIFSHISTHRSRPLGIHYTQHGPWPPLANSIPRTACPRSTEDTQDAYPRPNKARNIAKKAPF